MFKRWMHGWLLAFATAWPLAVPAAEPDSPGGSFLTTVTPAAAGTFHSSTVPYTPHAGDIVCFNDHNPVWKFLYRLYGSDMPDHAGLMVQLPNGGAAVLESGPDDGSTVGPYVFFMEALPRFNQYKGQFHGEIYIRRLACPLTPQQCDQLTDWGMAQLGKRYPTWRLLLQGTPCRCRSGLREKYFAKTDTNRHHYLCSELAIAGLAHVGVFDPTVIKGNRVYPRDILYDDIFDISASHLPAGQWTACPPTEPLLPIQTEIPEKPTHGKPSCMGMRIGTAQ